jgi:hypothetical protein
MPAFAMLFKSPTIGMAALSEVCAHNTRATHNLVYGDLRESPSMLVLLSFFLTFDPITAELIVKRPQANA